MRRGYRYRFGLLLLVICATGWGVEATNLLKERYLQANRAYRNGDYQTAIDAYRFVLSQAPDGRVYSNLGNAYFRQGKRGWAIWAYERAHRLLPRDDAIRADLDYLNTLNEDRFEYPAYPLSLAQIYGRLTHDELVRIYRFLYSGLMLVLTAHLLLTRGRRWTKPLLGVLLFLIGLNVLCALLKWHADSEGYAIIVAEQAEVYSGPGTQFDQLFLLHEGAKVETLRLRQDWIEISTPDDRRGWIRTASMAKI